MRQTPFDGFSGAKFDILKPIWLPTTTHVGNHTFRATGVTAYLKNGGTLERAAQMSNHASTRTTQLYDRRAEEVTLDEVERILV